MVKKSILVLGVGNQLLSDEGVGVHVAQQLQQMQLPPHIEVVDGGTAGLQLARHFRGKKKIIIVDAIKADAKPGTVVRLTREDLSMRKAAPFSAHQNGLKELLNFTKEFMPRQDVILYGVVPKRMQPSMRLSRTLQRRIGAIVSAVLEEASESNKHKPRFISLLC